VTETPSPAAPASRIGVWVLAARPKTLWAAVAPVAVGTAMAIDAGGFHAGAALVALLGALLIQIGTNYSNDYSDFLKGADTHERVGPLRVTQAGLVSPEAVRRAAALMFALAFGSGMYLVWRGGWPILVVGVLSIVSGILYTAGRKSIGYMGLGDVFVLIFFGPVAVGGTYYVQALNLPWPVIVAGLGPGLLAVAILLANNIRDVEQDRVAGKRTLVVRLGRRFGTGLYATCLIGAAVVPIALAALLGSHLPALAAALVLLGGIPLHRKLVHEPVAANLNPVLGATARLLILYSLLFSVGWILGD
jgi:1,4-dihydroxy-2-naphthoate octaprenyltransferase